MKYIALFVVVVGLVAGCNQGERNYQAKVSNPEFLHRSLKAITDRIVHDIFSPPVASRIYTYTTVAAYEAARHQDPGLRTLAGQLNGLDSLPRPDKDKMYSFPVASVKAALKVGRALVFTENEVDAFQKQIFDEIKATGIPDDVLENSMAYGDKVADHVIAWSSKDNYKQMRSFPKYTILTDPGTWKPTPPAYMDAVEPHWNKLRPFVIDSASQFRPSLPTVFSTAKNSQFYKEAEEVYLTGKNMTQEQREIASFWDCNPFVMNVKGHVMFASKKISPGGHWINITRVACTMQKTDFAHAAEAYARVSISLADGFIICWDEKYRSRLIRPETYINQYIDEAWTPLLQTPPFPEYTSGHSVISSSAATALTGLFGETFAYTDSTEVEFGMTARKFNSFLEASNEAAISRLYGGIHYRPAIDNGVKQGRAVGAYIRDKVKTRQ